LVDASLVPPPGIPVRPAEPAPNSEEAIIVAALRRGDYASAQLQLLRLLLAEPENPELRRAYASVLLAEQEFDAALRQFSWLQERSAQPQDETLFQLAWVYQGLGQGTEALRCSQELLQRRPHWSAAWIRHGLLVAADDPKASRVAFERALMAPFPYPTGLLEVGNFYVEQGQPREALPFFKRCLSFPGQNSWAANNLGNAYKALRDISSARRYYQLAITLDAKNPNPHNALGVLAEESGNLAAALEAYRQAILLDASYLDAQFNAGVVLLKLGRPAEALRCLEQARALRPEFGLTYFHLSEALAVMGQIDRARLTYQQAITLEPDLRKLRSRIPRVVKP
jgi:tetratricopeptide (TPR) repeat protein